MSTTKKIEIGATNENDWTKAKSLQANNQGRPGSICWRVERCSNINANSLFGRLRDNDWIVVVWIDKLKDKKMNELIITDEIMVEVLTMYLEEDDENVWTEKIL